MRTHYCTEVTEKNIGETVTVAGWVNSRRDHGGIIFIDLRDKDGLVQLVADPQDSQEALTTAETVRDEFVLIATGKVFHKLINPKRNMPAEAYNVHGFSEDFLKNKETFDQLRY